MSRLEDIKKEMAKLKAEADRLANKSDDPKRDKDMEMKKAMVLKRLRNSQKGN